MNKIIYLDAAATYQKSESVIRAETDFLTRNYANAGRGICARAVAVDDMVARCRARVAGFMNARTDQIVFTSGTTDGMNLIANMVQVSARTKLLVSDIDHHSARLPFQQRVLARAGVVSVCPLDDNLNIDVQNIPYADIFVITAMSNVMGMAQDVAQIVKAARQKNPNVITVVDVAQYVVHEKIDVRVWDCDFVCWSGHKIGADTGVGVMYIKNPDMFQPVKFGGGMVNKIQDDKIIWNMPPDVFEAGTLPLTQIAGLAQAIDELMQNRPNTDLVKYAYDELMKIEKIKVLSQRDAAVLTFVVNDMHVLDFGAMMGARDVCVRVGNMCASWIFKRLNLDGAIRMSVGAYNTIDDVKQFIKCVKEIVK